MKKGTMQNIFCILYNKMKKILFVFLPLLLVSLVFSGCGGPGKQEDEPTPYPVRVASVTIEKAPQKVVCLSPSLTELTCELGFESRLVGRTDDALYPDEVASLPSVGKTGHIDTAALAALAPDTVVSHESLSKKEMEALDAAGIQVVVLPMVHSLEEWENLYSQLALLYAGQIEADSIAASHYQKITDGLAEIQKKLPSDELQNGFLYVINPTSNIIATGDTFESSVLSAVFGQNAAALGSDYQIEAESLAKLNPSVVFTADPYGQPHLEQSSTYQNLEAVKNEKTASVDSTLFAVQSVRVLEAVKELAASLYPDLFEEESSSSAISSAGAASESASSAGVASGTD